MNRGPASWWLALLCGFWATLASCADVDELNQAFPKSTLQIATPDARIHAFNVWLALDDPHRERGLMFVRNLPDNAGMLFVYESPRPISMWMKNTFIPLDMVFIDPRGRVQSVASDARPQSLDIIGSKGAAYAVLELKAGTAKYLHIEPGAIVTHPKFFKTAAQAKSEP